MPMCQAINCHNKPVRGKNLAFFSIPDPLREPERCRAWLSHLGTGKFDFSTYVYKKSRVVCEEHFEATCFVPDLKPSLGLPPRSRPKLLTKDAVPTIFNYTFRPKRRRRASILPKPSPEQIEASPFGNGDVHEQSVEEPCSLGSEKGQNSGIILMDPEVVPPETNSDHRRSRKNKVPKKLEQLHKYFAELDSCEERSEKDWDGMDEYENNDFDDDGWEIDASQSGKETESVTDRVMGSDVGVVGEGGQDFLSGIGVQETNDWTEVKTARRKNRPRRRSKVIQRLLKLKRLKKKKKKKHSDHSYAEKARTRSSVVTVRHILEQKKESFCGRKQNPAYLEKEWPNSSVVTFISGKQTKPFYVPLKQTHTHADIEMTYTSVISGTVKHSHRRKLSNSSKEEEKTNSSVVIEKPFQERQQTSSATKGIGYLFSEEYSRNLSHVNINSKTESSVSHCLPLPLAPELNVEPLDNRTEEKHRCDEEAKRMVCKANERLREQAITDPKINDLVASLTALMLQIKSLATKGDMDSFGFKTLNESIAQIKGKLDPSSYRCFQDNVEVHMAHIQSGMSQMGNLHAFSEKSAFY